MTTLHFDTGAGQTTVTAISTCRANIETELTNLRSRVTGMVGADWISNSATIFQGEFDTWASQVTQTLQALDTLRTRLEQEIAEWENAAQALA